MFDTILRGGTVIDGTGRPAFPADVGITGGTITAVGDPSAAAGRTMDVAGRTVTPGFIDIHRHADAAAFRPDYGSLELRQGLTTIVNGNCGLSAAPFGPDHAAAIRAYLRPITGDIPDTPALSVSGRLSGSAAGPAPAHRHAVVGAGILRADTAGYELEHLDEAHYRAIHRAMERALGDGALGVSLGLGYAPECFCTTEELIQAAGALRGRTSPSPSICGRKAPVSAPPWRRCSPWRGHSASLCTSAI